MKIIVQLIAFLLMSAAFAVEVSAQDQDKTHSIAEGTKITLADGSEKNIEDITNQDEVIIFNPSSVKIGTCKVAAVQKTVRSNLVKLTLANGHEIELTPSKPLLGSKGWLSCTPKATKSNEHYKDQSVNKCKIDSFVLSTDENMKVEVLPVVSIDEVTEAKAVYTLELSDKNVAFIANDIFLGQQ